MGNCPGLSKQFQSNHMTPQSRESFLLWSETDGTRGAERGYMRKALPAIAALKTEEGATGQGH